MGGAAQQGEGAHPDPAQERGDHSACDRRLIDGSVGWSRLRRPSRRGYPGLG
jgi:hypothetical protein